MTNEPVSLWTEIKPILGPLIQAGVVLIVGAFTVWFQLRQARTAERKLFADIHDKRYKALSAFTRDVTDLAWQLLYEEQVAVEGEPSLPEKAKAKWRALNGQVQELTWLFGSDVMIEVVRMQDHTEKMLDAVLRFEHRLKSDNPVELVDQINVHNELFNNAVGRLNEASRHYLYVGHIKAKVPFIRGFTTDELMNPKT